MKGEWDDIDCLAYEGPIRVAFGEMEHGYGFLVFVDDVEVGRTSWSMEKLEVILCGLLPADAASRLALEAATNLGPWM